MRFRGLLILLVMLAVVACEATNVEQVGRGDGRDSDNDVQKAKDITNYEDCSGNVPAGLTLQSHSWGISEVLEDLQTDTVLTFTNSNLTLKVRCYYPDRTVVSEVRSAVDLTATQIFIRQEVTDVTRYDSPQGVKFCEANLARATLNYQFQGTCLRIEESGSTQLFPSYN